MTFQNMEDKEKILKVSIKEKIGIYNGSQVKITIEVY